MRLRNYILSVGFLACIFILGIGSDIKAVKFYKEGKPINEAWSPDLGRQNETEYAGVFLGKEELINLNGGMRRVLGQQEMNKVVRLRNGQMTELKEKPIKKKKLRREAANVAAFSAFLDEEDIPFLYVIPPDKVAPYEILPAGYLDYSNHNIDIFKESLESWDVPMIDLRQTMLDDGIDWYSYFYKTDHHWTSEAGWYAYGKIADWITDNTDVDLDKRAMDPANYTTEHYKKCLLGTWGQRTGTLFAGADDITLYVPTYETNVENLTFQKRGTMDQAVYNRDYIHEGKPEFIFDAVFDSTDQFVNYSADSTATILIITDSFGRVVNPFLVLSARNMWFHSSYQTETINEKMIDKLDPDVVIMLQSGWNNLGEDKCFSFDIPGVKN